MRIFVRFLVDLVDLSSNHHQTAIKISCRKKSVHFLKPVFNILYLVRQRLILMKTFTFQCIPYLVANSADNERLCHVKAEQCLNNIDGRCQGFIHMKALQGVKMAYEVQKVIQKVKINFDTVSMEYESNNCVLQMVAKFHAQY